MPPKASATAKPSTTQPPNTVVQNDIIPASEIRGRIAAFLDAVSNPLKPTCCAWCFAVLVFGTLDKKERVTQLQKTGQAFLRACLCLIIALAELPVPPVKGALAESMRGCPDKHMHKHRLHGVLTDAFDIRMQALFFVVDLGLSGGTNPVVRAAGSLQLERQCFHRRNGAWPVGVKSLFPLGVQRTVSALVHWACAPFSAGPMRILVLYTNAAYPVVYPALLEDPLRERVVWLTMQCLTPGPGVPWLGPPPFALPRGLAVPPQLRRNGTLLDHVFSLLIALYGGVQTRAGDVHRLFAGHERLLRGALAGVVVAEYEEGDGSRAASIDRTIADYTCLLDAALGEDAPDGECPHGFDPDVVKRAIPTLVVLRRAADGGWCAGPGCDNNEIAADGVRRFFRCGSCQAVRYCSVECQRNDYKRGDPSHKQICPTLTLMHTGGVVTNLGSQVFEAGLAAIGLDPKDIDVLHKWALGRGLLYLDRHYLPKALPVTEEQCCM